MRREMLIPALAWACVLAGLTGCAATAYRERYEPSIAEMSWQVIGESRRGEVRALVTASAERGGATGPTVHVRLRFTNDTPEPASLPISEVELVSPELEPIGRPRSAPRDPLILEPGERRTVHFEYAFSQEYAFPGNLNLSVPLRILDQTIRRSVTFSAPEPDARGRDGRYGGGFYHHHRHHGFHGRHHFYY